MKKQEFLEKLRTQLWALSEADQKNSLEYYAEMIDDRMEDGLGEEEAVAAIGDLEEIVKQIMTELPHPPAIIKNEGKQAEQKKQDAAPKQNAAKAWLIILLILGSPVWGSLVISVAATIFSVYVSLWAVVISLYAVFIALAAAAVGCVVGSFFMIGRFAEVMVAWGAALVCAGLAILLFMLSNLAAKGLIALTKLCWNGVKGIFRGKERTA